MNTSALNMLNVTLGMSGISGADKAFSDSPDSEISFGDVFSQAVNAAAEVSPVEADTVEDTVEDAENITFAELTNELKDDIADAGEDVIKAAISILKSVGKAVELLMGTLKSDDTEEAPDDITSVFGMLLSIMPQKNDEVTSEEQAMELIGNIAEAVRVGAEEELPPLEIVKKVVKAISPKDSDDDDDDDREELANALLDILSSVAGIDRGDTFEFPETEVTEITVAKLSGILKEAVSDKPVQDIAKAVEEIINAPEQVEKTEVKFAEFLSRAETGRNMTESLPVLNIFNAASQLNDIRGGDDIIVPENTEKTDVYSELWTMTSKQLTDRLTEEISSPITDGAKELTVVLKPESLGEIAVKLSQDSEGRISVILAASNPEIGRAVSENAYTLTAALSKQNVTVSNVNVVEPNQAATFMELDFTGHGFDRRNGENNGNNGSARNSSAVVEIEAADEFRAQKLLKEAKLWATA